MIHAESAKAWASETAAMQDEILRLQAALRTAENTAKINLSVAKQRGEEIDRLRLVIAHEGDCTQAADDEAMRRGHEIERLRKENIRLLTLLCEHAPHTFEREFMTPEDREAIDKLDRNSEFAKMTKLRRAALDRLFWR